MADMKDKMKGKLNEAENKAHEVKGRLQQKRRDMMKDKGDA